MKKILMICVFLTQCCVFLCAKRAATVIDHPAYALVNAFPLSVSRVVLTDTATLVDFHLEYKSQDWALVSREGKLEDDKGRQYAVRAARGVEFDKKFYMPSTGHGIDYTLVFDPVDAHATSVNFREDVEGGFHVWGIQLRGNHLASPALPAGVSPRGVDAATPLPQPLQQYGVAIIRGRVLGFKPAMKGYLYYSQRGVINSGGMTTFQPDGTFIVRIAVTGTAPVVLSSMLFENVVCFVEPDKETRLCVNLYELSRRNSARRKDEKPYGRSYYVEEGPLATVAEELGDGELQRESRSYDTFLRDTSWVNHCATVAEVWKRLDGFCASQQSRLDSVPLSLATRQYLSMLYAIDLLSYRHLAPNYMLLALKSKGSMPQDSMKVLVGRLRREAAVYKKDLPRDLALLNDSKSLLYYTSLTPYWTTYYGPDDVAAVCGTQAGPYFDAYRVRQLQTTLIGKIPLSGEQLEVLDHLPENYQLFIREQNSRLLEQIKAQKPKTE